MPKYGFILGKNNPSTTINGGIKDFATDAEAIAHGKTLETDGRKLREVKNLDDNKDVFKDDDGLWPDTYTDHD